uniref:Superoxide dismutase n=1 Tax=Strigamia maritima TaxID=126957 RepID=T1ILY4_STRMM
MLRCIQNATTKSRGLMQIRLKHTLPPLPYEANALEPVISAEIMQLHHSKHHATYVTNLNAALDKLKEAQSKNCVSSIIAIQQAIRFNGGGHLNHSIFWNNLTPKGGGVPSGELAEHINRDFGNFDNMKTQLTNASIGVQGSGWGWLGFNTQNKKLQIATCANQDPLQATMGLVPLFGIDVWEHAYYLQYKNVRPDYVKAIFNIANWADVAQRFQKAKSM